MPKIQQSSYKQATYWLGVIIIGLTVGLGIQFTQAWVSPSATPPNGNIAGPLTTGNTNQTKAGGVITIASSGGSLYAGGLVAAPRICIGGACRTTWPQTSGGDNLGNHIATQNLNMAGKVIINLADPKAPQDAATKAYVDKKVGASGNVYKHESTVYCGGTAFYCGVSGYNINGLPAWAGNAWHYSANGVTSGTLCTYVLCTE